MMHDVNENGNGNRLIWLIVTLSATAFLWVIQNLYAYQMDLGDRLSKIEAVANQSRLEKIEAKIDLLIRDVAEVHSPYYRRKDRR